MKRCASHVTIYSHFPHYCRVQSQLDPREVPGSVRSLLGALRYLVFSLRFLSLGLNFPFEISTFFHSSECILSVIWSISALLAFDPILGSKAGGGGQESDLHEVMVHY